MDLESKPILVVSCALRPQRGDWVCSVKISRLAASRDFQIAKERGEARAPHLIQSVAEGSRFHKFENHRAEFSDFSKGGPESPAASARRRPPIPGRASRATEPHSAEFKRGAQYKIALGRSPRIWRRASGTASLVVPGGLVMREAAAGGSRPRAKTRPNGLSTQPVGLGGEQSGPPRRDKPPAWRGGRRGRVPEDRGRHPPRPRTSLAKDSTQRRPFVGNLTNYRGRRSRPAELWSGRPAPDGL